MFVLRSSDGPGVELRLLPSVAAEHFVAEVEGAGLSAHVDVYAFEPREVSFASYFQGLARRWSGWRSEEEWHSLEGELRIAASMDRAGHVTFVVSLSAGAPRVWKATVEISSEAGQLDRIAEEARAFARLVYPSA